MIASKPRRFARIEKPAPAAPTVTNIEYSSRPRRIPYTPSAFVSALVEQEPRETVDLDDLSARAADLLPR